MREYVNVLILTLCAIAIAVVILVCSHWLGVWEQDMEKVSVYECGFDPLGAPRVPYSVKFIIVAILFIIFDVEIGSIIPWCVCLSIIILVGVWVMYFFLTVLGLGLFYEWIRGGLEWDVPVLNVKGKHSNRSGGVDGPIGVIALVGVLDFFVEFSPMLGGSEAAVASSALLSDSLIPLTRFQWDIVFSNVWSPSSPVKEACQLVNYSLDLFDIKYDPGNSQDHPGLSCLRGESGFTDEQAWRDLGVVYEGGVPLGAWDQHLTLMEIGEKDISIPVPEEVLVDRDYARVKMELIKSSMEKALNDRESSLKAISIGPLKGMELPMKIINSEGINMGDPGGKLLSIREGV